MITVAGGGSSSVFRNACGVSPVMRSTSSSTKTLRRAAAGLSAASRSSSRIALIRMARAPFGFDSGGVGTITCRSGCCREGLPRSSAAKASAVVTRPAPEGPMKAYACATRSLARARCKSSTARVCAAMRPGGTKRSGAARSGATEEGLHDQANLGLDLVGRAPRVDQPHALGLGPADLEIAAAHAPVKHQRLALEVVEAPPPDAPESLRGIEIEEQREVREDPARGPHVQLADQVRIDAAAVALVGDRRIGVPVAEDDPAAREPRPNFLRDVLLARGHEQEDLDERLGLDTGALEKAAYGESEPRSAGLTGAPDLPPLRTKPSPEPHHLGCLARPLDALERNQESTHAQTIAHASTPAEPGGGAVPRRDREWGGGRRDPFPGSGDGSRAPGWSPAAAEQRTRADGRLDPPPTPGPGGRQRQRLAGAFLRGQSPFIGLPPARRGVVRYALWQRPLALPARRGVRGG